MHQDPNVPNASALLQQARDAREQGRFARARECFEALLDLHLEPALEADVRAGLASVLHMTGQSMDALTQLHLALAVREQLGHHNGVAGIQLNLGILYGDLGQHALALEHYEQAREMLREEEDPARLLILHVNLGRAHIEHGDVEAGERVTHEGLAMVSDATPARVRVTLQLNLAEALRRRGQLDDAAHQYAGVVERSMASRLRDVQQRALHGQALVQVARGEHVRARELLFEALTLARRSDDLDAELLAMTGLAEVSLATGQFGIAMTDAELILIRAEQGRRPRFTLHGHDLMARACEGLSDFEGAYEHVLQARAIERTLQQQEGERRVQAMRIKLKMKRLQTLGADGEAARDTRAPAPRAIHGSEE